MKYINYHNDKLSKLSLGTVQFGLDYGIANIDGKLLRRDINTIINFVCDHGINCFDTAQAYGDAENILGKALTNKKDEFIISKLTSDLFSDNLENNISKSLENLNINRLYGLLLHDSKLLYRWDNKNSKLVNNLINNKKIKYFGVSVYNDEEFTLALENNDINIIQIPFNLFDQRAIKNSWLKKAKEKNKLIFIRSIYLQGLLLMDIKNIPKYLQSVVPYIVLLEQYCVDLKMTKNELALSFVNSIVKDGILLFGCDNLKQAKENINIFNNIKILDEESILKIYNSFKNISEAIYNPAKW